MRFAFAVLIVASVARADVTSGPDVGTKPAGFKVFAATGAYEGKEVDFPAERKELPTVYFFVNADHWGRPTARFIKQVDDAVGQRKDKAESVAVWLTDKSDDAKEYLPKVQQSMQMQATALTVYTADKAGPKDWKLNDKAHVTVVVVHKGVVKERLAFVAVNDSDVRKVTAALAKAIDGK